MIKKIITLLLIVVAFNGCTRDDICPEGSDTTPLLIIVFKDILDPSEAKAVPNLTVRADYSNNVDVLVAANTDSIAIPLRTGADDTRFQFINENEDGTFTNVDILSFLYQREDVYLNRACGFKTIYNQLGFNLEGDPNNWLLNIQIETQTVEDETETHVTILH
tara:strand:+ start:53104 stop:53592 length:489 start_codon:yes stop_codon:yes gene_type:complete